MQRPSRDQLAAPLANSARQAVLLLAERGYRGWIVGGAVRDLALGRAPTDVDLTTDARPDEVEAAFSRTAAVGKAFGTVLVLDFEVELQITSLRGEGGYSDGRRPDEVRYTDSVEEDARRRDFTCNALYLDPLTDEVLDPEGGLADLEAGVLRCVGDAPRRFAEDGLRLLRLARLAAAHGLEVEAGTLAAAAAGLESLRGVSAERIYGELDRICKGPEPGVALELLHEIGVLERVLGGWGEQGPARLAQLRSLKAGVDSGVWFAALSGGDAEVLQALRAPRARMDGVRDLGRLGRALEEGGPRSRADRARLVRDPAWAHLLDWTRAMGGQRAQVAESLETFRAAQEAGSLDPEPLLSSDDLARAGLPPGPRWGELLLELETLQLEGELVSREQALAWLKRSCAS